MFKKGVADYEKGGGVVSFSDPITHYRKYQDVLQHYKSTVSKISYLTFLEIYGDPLF